MSERKLKAEYKQVYIKLTATLGWRMTPAILMPNDEVVPYDEAPDYCFAPEPKPPEFREGDWVDGRLDRRAYLEYFRVTDVEPDCVHVEDASGHHHCFIPCRLRLIHRPSTPTGPIRVGSYVGHTRCKYRGVVGRVRLDDFRPFRIRWEDGVYTSHTEDELIHIASPNNHEQR